MAMDGDTLGTAMMDAIDALSDEDKAVRSNLFKALGNAIVTHITTNGTVDLTALFTAGVPAPTDGGAALQTAWKAGGPQSNSIG